MTKQENPQNQERDFPLSWKAQTRASHIPTAPLLLLSSLQHPIKTTTTVCATRYLPDLPTDSSEEAKNEIAVLHRVDSIYLYGMIPRLRR